VAAVGGRADAWCHTTLCPTLPSDAP
jgi:hypothetical protein